MAAVGTAIVVLTQLGCLWRHPVFPSQNGPWFLAAGFVFLHGDDSSYAFSKFYQRSWHPIPHILHDAIVVALQLALPLHTAEKVALSLYVVALPVGLYYLLRAIAPKASVLAMLAFPMAYSYPFLRGYHDFTLSIPLALLSVGYWFRLRDRVSVRRLALLNVLTTLTYLAHLFTFFIVVACLFTIELAVTRSLRRSTRALLGGLGGWILFCHYAALNLSSSWISAEDTAWLPLHWTMQTIYDRFFFTTDHVAAGIASLPLILAMGVVLWGVIAKGLVRTDAGPTGLRTLAVLTVAVTLAYWAAPMRVIGWHKVCVRFVPFVVVAVICCAARVLQVARARALATVLSAVAVVCASVQTLRLDRDIGRMAALVQEYDRTCEILPRNCSALFLMLENPAFGAIRPLTRAYDYSTIRRGAIHGQSLARYNTLALVWYRHYPVDEMFPQMTFHELVTNEQAARRSPYDYVVTYGRANEVDQLAKQSRILKLVRARGKMRIFQIKRH